MIRRIKTGLIIAVCFVVYGATTASAIDAIPAPERLDAAPLLITGYGIDTTTPRYLEIYNNSNDPINVADWRFSVEWSDGITKLDLPFSETEKYIMPKKYIVIGFGDDVPNASVHVDAVTGELGTYITQISLHMPTYIPYIKVFSSPQSESMRLNQTSTGYTSTTNYSIDTRTSLYDDGFYEIGVSAPSSFPLLPIEMLANPRSCSPLETDIACREYVKFYNYTDQAVSFANTQLRIGDLGQSGAGIPLAGVLQPGEYAVFDKTAAGGALSMTNTGAYVWLEDVYGIKIYENTVAEYPDASSSTRKGQSWANIHNEWQWAMPSPGGQNTPIPEVSEETVSLNSLIPCRSDQYRNPETNRCRLIGSTTSSLTPCSATQYRSPETNRCRSISATTNSLVPCTETQYRNPETNRCRNIADASTSLKPCSVNQERNPETNRCRNVLGASISKASHAPKEVASGSASGGWLALVIVGSLAIGYAVWEWRRELVTMFGKVKSGN